MLFDFIEERRKLSGGGPSLRVRDDRLPGDVVLLLAPIKNPLMFLWKARRFARLSQGFRARAQFFGRCISVVDEQATPAPEPGLETASECLGFLGCEVSDKLGHRRNTAAVLEDKRSVSKPSFKLLPPLGRRRTKEELAVVDRVLEEYCERGTEETYRQVQVDDASDGRPFH